MKTFKSIAGAIGLVLPLALSAGAASAEDTAQGRHRTDQQLGKSGADARPGRRHLQEAWAGAGEYRHARRRRNHPGGDLGQRRYRRGRRRGRRDARFLERRAGAHPGAGLHWHRRSFLVREGGFQNQKPEGHHGRKHHRLFDQRFELEQYCGRFRQRAGREGKADGHGRPACDADRGDVRPGRYRLGSAAVRPAGNQGRQNPHRRAWQRCALAARANRAHADRQCQFAEDQA